MNIYGASGHAKVIMDIARSKGIKIGQLVDDNETLTHLQGHPINHSPDVEFLKGDVVVAIGNNSTRKKIAKKIKCKYHKAIAHRSAVIAEDAQLGEGTVIMANASINSSVCIGEHCIINTGATVEHDCVLEDFVHISPNAALAGNVKVGEGTHIGIGAIVIPGIKIGKWVTIGAGAVIIKDVPDEVVVVGNPGRIIEK